jgi:hypothetical protein
MGGRQKPQKDRQKKKVNHKFSHTILNLPLCEFIDNSKMVLHIIAGVGWAGGGGKTEGG